MATPPEGEPSPPPEPLFTASENDPEDILALIAHELRSPLTVVLGAARLLERSQTYLPDHVNSIIQASKRQDRIISDILTLAQIGVGGLELYRREFDINELVGSYLRNIPYLTDRHTAVFTRTPDPIVVNSDPMRIEQVLDKLINNAIKYSPDGGEIDLEVLDQEESVRVSVRDHGVGIMPEDLTPNLFGYRRRFKTGIPGLGFGLYVAQAIVKAHGGEIWTESDGENKGSTFHFTLPHTPNRPLP